MLLQLLRIIGAVINVVSVLRHKTLKFITFHLLHITDMTRNYQFLLFCFHFLLEGFKVLAGFTLGFLSQTSLTGLCSHAPTDITANAFLSSSVMPILYYLIVVLTFHDAIISIKLAL